MSESRKNVVFIVAFVLCLVVFYLVAAVVIAYNRAITTERTTFSGIISNCGFDNEYTYFKDVWVNRWPNKSQQRKNISLRNKDIANGAVSIKLDTSLEGTLVSFYHSGPFRPFAKKRMVIWANSKESEAKWQAWLDNLKYQINKHNIQPELAVITP